MKTRPAVLRAHRNSGMPSYTDMAWLKTLDMAWFKTLASRISACIFVPLALVMTPAWHGKTHLPLAPQRTFVCCRRL